MFEKPVPVSISTTVNHNRGEARNFDLVHPNVLGLYTIFVWGWSIIISLMILLTKWYAWAYWLLRKLHPWTMTLQSAIQPVFGMLEPVHYFHGITNLPDKMEISNLVPRSD